MIILASDYVGHKVLEYLCDINEIIDVLVLDRKDRGNVNNNIISKIKNNARQILYWDDLRDVNILEKLKVLDIDYGITAWWPYILKNNIINLTTKGWINIHPSYLPYNRGKHPYFWSLVEETPFGATLHFIDEGIDSGDIIDQSLVSVSWLDTGETLYNKARETSLELFKKNYENIKKGQIKRKKQYEKKGSFHYSKDLDSLAIIDLEKTYKARTLINIIRGRMFNNDSETYFYDAGKKYKLKLTIEEVKNDEIN